MQVLDRSRLMAIPPIWRLGFRPFFLGGALFAVLAIALWLAALAGLWSGWQPVGGWLAWHRHEMLFGFGVAIIAGFLLTAVQTWTGVPGLQGKPLALLAGLWLAARLAWLFDAPLALLLVLQLSFLPLLAWAIGRSLWRVRQKRNYPVVGLLLLLTLADALVLLGLFEGNDDWQRRASIAALWLIAGMMNLIGGRVIRSSPSAVSAVSSRCRRSPGWTMASCWAACWWRCSPPRASRRSRRPGLQDCSPPSVVRNCGACGVARSRHLAGAAALVSAPGIFLDRRGAAWHGALEPGPGAGAEPGAARAGGGRHGRVDPGDAGTGHSRPYRSRAATAGSDAWAFALLNLGCAARVFLPSLLPANWALPLAGGLWALAFLLFAWFYAPMLCRPRVDGHPG